MTKSSNIGQTGVASIRLKGQRIEDMPLGTNNQAIEQLPMAIETERLNAIAEINAQYPHQRIDYLSARISECEENKNRMRRFVTDTMAKINEYRGLITMTKMRDKLLKIAESEEERKQIMRDHLPYDIDELEKQITQFEEAIEKAEEIVKTEDASIKEHSEVISLCRERDRKLAQLGAVQDRPGEYRVKTD